MAATARTLAGLGAAAVAAAGLGALAVAQRPPPPPRQPVAFSHAIHAGNLALDCRFCHWTAETAPHAGMPDMETCAGCHWPVATRPLATPLAWTRVARLPDHAVFDHAVHVDAGFACAACHGDVAGMERTRAPERPWSMLFCLECHRAHEAPGRGTGRLTNCHACHR